MEDFCFSDCFMLLKETGNPVDERGLEGAKGFEGNIYEFYCVTLT